MSSRGEAGRITLAWRLFLGFGGLIVALALLTGWFVDRRVTVDMREQAIEAMATTAIEGRDSLPDRAGLAGWVEQMFADTGDRFSVIDSDGVVLADSHADTESMENHRQRPEVVAALSGEVGVSTRPSETTGFDQVYVAAPSEDGLIVRVSSPLHDIDDTATAARGEIVAITLLAIAVGLIAAWLLARLLARPVALVADEAGALVAGGAGPLTRSSVAEVDRLGQAVLHLREAQEARVTQAEQATETLETVLGALPGGTLLFSEEGNVVYANHQVQELVGSIPEALSTLAPFAFQALVRESRAAAQPRERAVEHGKPPRRLLGMATPVGEGQVLLIVTDVTDRERAASVRRDFVANASHELKTPVSAIIASSEALQIAVGRGDGTAPTFARQIEHSALQLDRLVTDLLDLSRLERDRPELDPLELDLLVREELERMRPAAEVKAVTIGFDLTPVEIAGSRRDVAVAVRNLLDNAVRYTSEGTITTTLVVDDGHAVLSVADSGEGIPTRDLDRVFERFYRVDNARSRATGGTGLGLAIVRHVVESHGGSVEVESELGRGSTFTVRFPVAAI